MNWNGMTWPLIERVQQTNKNKQQINERTETKINESIRDDPNWAKF